MRHVKVLLQLHSIKLILFSALAIVFLAMTPANSSNKTETTFTSSDELIDSTTSKGVEVKAGWLPVVDGQSGIRE